MSLDKNVPEIRFAGFSGEWDKRKLDTIFSKIRNAFVGTATPYYVKKGNFYLESNNVKNGKINRKKEIFISDEFYHKQSDKWLRADDIVMVQSGHVGHTAVIPPELNNIAAHALIMFTDPKEKISPHFLNFQFQTDKVKTKLEEITTGNTIRHILSSEMKEFEVPFTNCEEQTQIGNYFQKLDSLITQHQQKHDKLSNIKKAMLQKMFPKSGETIPEIRFEGFSGDWKEKELRDICTYHTSSLLVNDAKSEGKYKLYDANKSIGYTNENIQNKDYITIIKDGSGVGRVRLLPKKTSFISTMGAIQAEKSNIIFLYCCLIKIDFSKHISGATIPHVYFSHYGSDNCSTPRIEEQTKIGNYFQKLDELITQHQQQTTKLNNIKQACLTKMFV